MQIYRLVEGLFCECDICKPSSFCAICHEHYFRVVIATEDTVSFSQWRNSKGQYCNGCAGKLFSGPVENQIFIIELPEKMINRIVRRIKLDK